MKNTELELPERILVVEDDRMIRAMLRKTFTPHAVVLEAEDGDRGYQMLRTERPDFAVTDLMLPGMSGLDLIQRARRAYFGACIPILVLTANTGEDVLLECFRQGADDFMVKPFSLQELRVRISSIYLRHRLARDVNPLTRLPGNLVIKREVEARLEEGRTFALAILDLDHFKAFNDSRGFDAGDDAIRLLGDVLNELTLAWDDDDVFVGHIGGDDFLLLASLDDVERHSREILAAFADRVRRFYDPDELNRGVVTIVNRHGQREEVPLLSLSIGVVASDRPGLSDFRSLTQVASEVKRVAKASPGNSLFIDRRRSPTTADLTAAHRASG